MNHALLPSKNVATLPAKYEAAKLALAECNRIDECKDWGEGKPPPSSGVYTFWVGATCVYVGQSRNMRKRMTGHHRKREWPECRILWVECESTLRMEEWFIHHLEPTGNGWTQDAKDLANAKQRKHAETPIDDRLGVAWESLFGTEFGTL